MLVSLWTGAWPQQQGRVLSRTGVWPQQQGRVLSRTGACPQQQGSAGGEPTGLERLAVLTVATLGEHADDVISWETCTPVVEDTTVDG